MKLLHTPETNNEHDFNGFRLFVGHPGCSFLLKPSFYEEKFFGADKVIFSKTISSGQDVIYTACQNYMQIDFFVFTPVVFNEK